MAEKRQENKITRRNFVTNVIVDAGGIIMFDVLVVDDQPGIRFLLDIVIREEGYNIITANNGQEAIEKVRANKPQLVFMDIKMPVMDGLEALEEIKKFSTAKIVLMSAYTDKMAFERANSLGAYCCMGKPFDVQDIKKILEKVKKENDIGMAQNM